MLPWVVLLLVAAASASASDTTLTTTCTASETMTSKVISRSAFISSPSILRPIATTVSSSNVPSLVILTASSPNQSLIHQILQGATRKLLLIGNDDSTDSSVISPPVRNSQKEDRTSLMGQYTYYVREGHRSEIDKITDTLMNSFHPDSKPSFDSYIRRYKYNHLQMCFDAIDECDRGLFVACAVPTPTTSSELSSDDHHHHQQQQQQIEQIIGFCSVDGRTPDPSCRIEFLTPSTLAGTSPRPYLSDLGVSTMHRRKGIGNMLVRACEHWAWSRGYDTLYLKVEKENVGAVRLYSALGYTKTKMQWDNDSFVGKKSFGGGSNILLMEKSMNKSGTARQNRTWI